jgi:hypothetical protein
MESFKYYTLRRLNPYLGVLQVIDGGSVRVYSSEGKTWRPRRVEDSERFWPAEGAGSHGYGRAAVSKESLTHAIEQHPPLPFPPGDHFELWLLHKTTSLPLALLHSRHWKQEVGEATDPTWRAFPPGNLTFEVPTLRVARGSHHGEMLEWGINDAARPLPAAQWFQRTRDGGGIGLGGLRLQSNWSGRNLPATAFPELLITENWETAEMTQLAQGYHNWHAALLLAHGHLSRQTRQRLEQAVQTRPEMLVESRLLLPEVLNPEALKTALVAAQLLRSL